MAFKCRTAVSAAESLATVPKLSYCGNGNDIFIRSTHGGRTNNNRWSATQAESRLSNERFCGWQIRFFFSLFLLLFCLLINFPLSHRSDYSIRACTAISYRNLPMDEAIKSGKKLFNRVGDESGRGEIKRRLSHVTELPAAFAASLVDSSAGCLWELTSDVCGSSRKMFANPHSRYFVRIIVKHFPEAINNTHLVPSRKIIFHESLHHASQVFSIKNLTLDNVSARIACKFD